MEINQLGKSIGLSSQPALVPNPAESCTFDQAMDSSNPHAILRAKIALYEEKIRKQEIKKSNLDAYEIRLKESTDLRLKQLDLEYEVLLDRKLKRDESKKAALEEAKNPPKT